MCFVAVVYVLWCCIVCVLLLYCMCFIAVLYVFCCCTVCFVAVLYVCFVAVLLLYCMCVLLLYCMCVLLLYCMCVLLLYCMCCCCIVCVLLLWCMCFVAVLYQGSTLSFLAGCPKSHFLGWHGNFLVYWYLKLDNKVFNLTCSKEKSGWIWRADDP